MHRSDADGVLTSGLVLVSRAAAGLSTSLAGLMGVNLAVGELCMLLIRKGVKATRRMGDHTASADTLVGGSVLLEAVVLWEWCQLRA